MEKDAQKDMFDGSCLDSALLTIISSEPRAAESATGTLWEGLHSDIREDLSEAKSPGVHNRELNLSTEVPATHRAISCLNWFL